MSDTCATCRFSSKPYKDGELYCRRYPPIVAQWYESGGNLSANAANRFEFAITREHQWCGEFLPPKESPR